MKKLLIFISSVNLLFLATGFSITQPANEIQIKNEIAALEKQNELLINRRTVLLAKNDSLTASIQKLKNEKSLNIFQRQQLEQWLQKSQAGEQQLFLLDHEIAQRDLLYQEKLNSLVDWYESQIDSLLTMQKTKAKKIQKSAYEKIVILKTERDFYAKKLKPLSFQKLPEGVVTIDEFDSYQKIKQKADLIKDQEEKVNKQKVLLTQQLAELENELKLRHRMNELISDTYLMDYQAEAPTQMAMSNIENSEKSVTNYTPLDYEDIRSADATLPTASSVDATDILMLEANVSEISTLNLEHYIQKLHLLNKQLAKSADSLSTKAALFYQAAEKKKQETEK